MRITVCRLKSTIYRKVTGTLKECSEGTLEWVSKDKIADLELWEGDLIFFELLKENAPFFCLKLRYIDNILKEANVFFFFDPGEHQIGVFFFYVAKGC